MKNNRKYNPAMAAMSILTALSITFLSSCDYKALEENTPALTSIHLDFQWQKVDSVPDLMRVAFYTADEITRSNFTKGYTFFDLSKRNWPATIQLPAGLYHVTAWNNDTEHVLTDKYGSQSTLHATTLTHNVRSTLDIPSVLDSLYNGQRVLDYPDYMVHANQMEYDVKYTDEQELTLYPDSMVVTVEYKIHGIGGLSWVRQIKGTVNNVAGKRYIAYPNRTEEPVSIMFDGDYTAEDSLVWGKFYIFGIEPTDLAELNHKMVLFFWMDGGKVYLPIDVTNIFHAYRRDQSKIVIETPSLDIDLRDFISSKNTFNVDLDEWDDVNIDIGF